MVHASGWESERCEVCLGSPCRKRCYEQRRAVEQIRCCYEAARIALGNVRRYLDLQAEKNDPRILGAMGTVSLLRREISKLRTSVAYWRALGVQ